MAAGLGLRKGAGYEAVGRQGARAAAGTHAGIQRGFAARASRRRRAAVLLLLAVAAAAVFCSILAVVNAGTLAGVPHACCCCSLLAVAAAAVFYSLFDIVKGFQRGDPSRPPSGGTLGQLQSPRPSNR